MIPRPPINIRSKGQGHRVKSGKSRNDTAMWRHLIGLWHRSMRWCPASSFNCTVVYVLWLCYVMLYYSYCSPTPTVINSHEYANICSLVAVWSAVNQAGKMNMTVTYF